MGGRLLDSGSRRASRALLAVGLTVCFACAGTNAAELRFAAVTPAGAPVADAVIELNPAGSYPARANPRSEPRFMRQADQQFLPQVLAIRVGGSVNFPNDDPMMHHVYSLSVAKSFELPLYGNKKIPAIEFERAGIVKLGCNIHDNMRGYIFVSDAYAVGVTATDGSALITGLPADTYEISIWHPRLRDGGQLLSRQVTLSADARQTLDVTLNVYPLPETGVGKFERGGYD